MNNLPRQILRQIVSKYGHALLEDPRLCQSLLRDLCGKYKSEINLLIIVQRLIIAREILRYLDSFPHQLLVSQLIVTMSEEFAFERTTAQWAVYSWAEALGLSVVETEVKESNEVSTVEIKKESETTQSTEIAKKTIAITKRTRKDGSNHRRKDERRRIEISASVDSPGSREGRDEVSQEAETDVALKRVYESGRLKERLADWIKSKRIRLRNLFGTHHVAAQPDLLTGKSRQTSAVELRLKYPLHEPPETAIWFKHELGEISSYIEAEQTTCPPLILTGYEGFGGTSIVNWGITQAKNRIADATGSAAETAVFVLHSHIDELNGEALLNIDKGLAHITNRVWHNFKEHFYDLFDHFNSYPFHNAGDVTTEVVNEVSPRVVGIKSPVEANWQFGKHIIHKAGTTSPPKPKAEQIRTLLNTLDNEIPTECERKRSDSGLPYRIVLVIDSVNDCQLLKAIEGFRPPFKALRIIIILNKHSYDQYMHSTAARFTPRFEIIRFLPLFQYQIARELCRYYFDIQEELLKNERLKTLIKGLEFRCRGLPGNFGKILKSQMEFENGLITLNSKTLKPWKRYQKVGTFLENNWAKILKPYFHVTALEDRELSATLRLYLYQVSEKIVDTCQGKSEQEMIDVCMAHAAKTWHPSNDSLTSDISQGLIRALSKEQLLTVKLSDEPW